MTSTTAQLVGLGCLAFIGLTITGATSRALIGLVKVAWLITRALCWVIVRPKLSIPAAVLALFTWLAWPILSAARGAGLGGMLPLYVIGGGGALAGGLLVGGAIVQQRRIDRDLEAEYDAGPEPGDVDTQHVPEWANE